jgi:Flp pilus assembly pilin Flp
MDDSNNHAPHQPTPLLNPLRLVRGPDPRGSMSSIKKLNPRASEASLIGSEAGLSTVEYAIVLVLVVAICIAVFQSFGSKLRNSLSGANDEFDTVNNTTY